MIAVFYPAGSETMHANESFPVFEALTLGVGREYTTSAMTPVRCEMDDFGTFGSTPACSVDP